MTQEKLQQTGLNEQLPRNQTRIDFLYTALLSDLDITKARDVLRDSKNYEDVVTLSGTTDGIEPFLNISDQSLTVVYPTMAATVEWEGSNKEKRSRKVTISRLVRLIQSGALCFRHQVASDESLQFEDLVRIVRAARDHLPLYCEGHEDSPKELFQLFKTDVERMLIDLSDGGLQCQWLDLGIELQHGQRTRKAEPCVTGEYFQYPYVVTSVKLADHRDKDIEKMVVEELFQGFAGVLRAVDGGFAGMHFLDTYLSRKANILPDTRAFLSLYPRSCLFVYGERQKHPGEETVVGIIDTVELLRMRWHSLVIVNILLARSIGDLRRTLQPAIAGRSKRSRAWLTRVLTSIAQLRIDTAEILEDPVAYRRATSHLNELYELGTERFRVNELQNLVLLKLAQVDRVYENIAELRRRSEIELLDREWAEIRKAGSKLEAK